MKSVDEIRAERDRLKARLANERIRQQYAINAIATRIQTLEWVLGIEDPFGQEESQG